MDLNSFIKTKMLFLLLIFFPVLVFSANVVSVKWESELPREDFEPYIKINEGKEFSIRDLRKSVKLIYATGRAKNVVVNRDKDVNGDYIITFFVKPSLFIHDVTIKGNHTLMDKDIKQAAGIKKFREFREEDLVKIRDEILAYYSNEGFANAKVSVEIPVIDSANINLFVNITEGERERIRSVKLRGDLNFIEKRELQMNSNLKYGLLPYTDTNVRDVIEYIRNLFLEKKFLDVKVRQIDTVRTTGVLLLEVAKESKYDVKIEGVDSFAPEMIREIINSVDDFQNSSEDVELQIKSFYQAAGYPLVSVKIKTENRRDGKNKFRTLKIVVNEGKRLFLKDILIEGAGKESDYIKTHIPEFAREIYEARQLPLPVVTRSQTGGGYTDTDNTKVKTLARSKENKRELPPAEFAVPELFFSEISEYILFYLQKEGYKDAVVKSIAQNIENSELKINVKIDLGKKYMLNWVALKNIPFRLETEIMEELSFKKVVPYTKKMEKSIQQEILRILQEKGYLFAEVIPERIENDGKVKLLFKLNNIFKVRVGNIVVRGNYNTSSFVIRKTLYFESGENITSLDIKRSEKRLRQTKLFENVKIYFLDEDTPSEKKDIIISISEANRTRVYQGIGLRSDEGFQIFGELEHKNILGSGVIGKFSYKLNRKLEPFMPDQFERFFDTFSFPTNIDRTVSLAFIMPDVFFKPLPISLQLEFPNTHKTERNGEDYYMTDKNGVQTSLTAKYEQSWYLSLTTEFAKKVTKRYEVTSNDVLMAEKSDDLVLSPEVNVYYDGRDSLVMPKKGFKIGGKAKEYLTLSGDNSTYGLFENYIAVYLPLRYTISMMGEMKPKDTLIFHSFFKYAFMMEHSGEIAGDDALKLGGSTTIRGFNYQSILPSDYNSEKDDYAKGKYYFYLRNELRLKVAENFYLIGFFDTGNMWQHLSSIGTGDFMRMGTGTGFMYSTPIGSINAQLGINVFPEEGEDRTVFHIFISSF